MVTPFRYTPIVFALVIAVTVFGEEIDALMLPGAGIVVGSGLFTLVREHRPLHSPLPRHSTVRRRRAAMPRARTRRA